MKVHCPRHDLPMQTEKGILGVYWSCAEGCVGVESNQQMSIIRGGVYGNLIKGQIASPAASLTGNLESADDS